MSYKSSALLINIFLVAVAVVFAVGACYEENPVTDPYFEDFEIPTITGVTPENGSSGVDRNTALNLSFSGPMDTATVTENLYLTGGNGMRQWMDSLGHMQGGGHSGDCDAECMIRWLDSISYSGQLYWNDNLDSCTFQPDSPLMADEDHMLFITGPVRGITGGPMNFDTCQYGGYISFFHTGP